MSIVTLPETVRDRKLEAIVWPVDENISVMKKAKVKGTTQSLVGVGPRTNLALAELRRNGLRNINLLIGY